MVITCVFLCAGYLLNSVYRPYIYTNGIADFGLADAGNNLIFVPSVYFLLLLVRNRPLTTYQGDILLILGVYLAREVLQLVGAIPGTFDWLDLIGLTIGAMFAFAFGTRLSCIDNRKSS